MNGGSPSDDRRIDFSALEPEVQLHSARVGSRVRRRIDGARAGAVGRAGLVDLILERLARLAIPACVVAAASLAVIVIREMREDPAVDPFLVVLIEAEQPLGWMAEGRRPETGELLHLLDTRR